MTKKFKLFIELKDGRWVKNPKLIEFEEDQKKIKLRNLRIEKLKKLIIISIMFVIVILSSCKKSETIPDFPQFSTTDSCQCFEVTVKLTIFSGGALYHEEYRFPLGTDSIIHFCQTKDTTIQMRKDNLTNYIKSGYTPTEVVYKQVKCN